MPQPIFANNVAGLLAANIGPADTAILLGAGQGSSFPAVTAGNWYYATIVHNTLGTVEIVKVTAKSADTLTVTRGQDGTSAVAMTTGSVVELRATAQLLRDIDWHTMAGLANGVATLDGTAKLTAAQLPTNVPTLTGGVLDMAVIPPAVATDVELALKLDKTGGTITGDLSITGNLVVEVAGTGSASLKVGNDAVLIDCNVANMMRLQGVANAAVGFLAFGTGNHNIGWNGGAFTADGQNLWTTGNFDPNSKLNVSNPSVSGSLTTSAAITVGDGRVQSGGTDLVLGGSGGGIYLRPHGVGNGTNHGVINASGLAQFVDVQSYSDKRFKYNIKRRDVDVELPGKLLFKDWLNKSDDREGFGLVAQDLLRRKLDRFVGGVPGNRSVDYAKIGLEVGLANHIEIQKIKKALNLR
jgi:hypothetical protein